VLEGAEVYRWLLTERRALALPFAMPLSSAGLEPRGGERG
jgi:hypothetical protein